jgi:hypothetical protein
MSKALVSRQDYLDEAAILFDHEWPAGSDERVITIEMDVTLRVVATLGELRRAYVREIKPVRDVDMEPALMTVMLDVVNRQLQTAAQHDGGEVIKPSMVLAARRMSF